MTSNFERDFIGFFSNLNVNEIEKINNLREKYSNYFGEISDTLYDKLNWSDKKWLIIWFAKRWGGVSKIPFDDYMHYKDELSRIKNAPVKMIGLNNKTYKSINLEDQGYQGELMVYEWALGIHDFLFKQYSNNLVKTAEGDVIIDAGAFVGDTAVIFGQETNRKCEIHAFELLDENIDLFHINVKNHNISEQVVLNKVALSNKSGSIVKINNKLLQGATSIFGKDDGEEISTITIDDYVMVNGFKKLDFIKMDIEGAERFAIEGSLETIKKFKPKLAICIYHLWDDIFEIPKTIQKSGINYQYSFKWVEFLNGWEAVLLCKPEN